MTSLEVRVNNALDDAEESDLGAVGLHSSDLEIVFDGSDQTVGMRFNNLTIPQSAIITEAYIQFKVDEGASIATNLIISAEATDNSGAFESSTQNISSRPRTNESIAWSPVAWLTIGEAGIDQRTPNLAPVIQEVISRSGWVSGNSLSIIIAGSGERVAESYNGDPGGAPLLHIEYRMDGATSTPVPTATNTPVPSPTPTPSGEVASLEVRVNNALDDAEESDLGAVGLHSSDLEIVFDGSDQTVGMRFNNLTIPQSAIITEAYIQFKVDEGASIATNLIISAEATDNSGAFESSAQNISSRPRTNESIAWSPVAWLTIGEAGIDQRTPNLAPVIQEVISRSGWVSGNSLSIIIAGSGERVAESYNGDPGGAPLLHIEYQE